MKKSKKIIKYGGISVILTSVIIAVVIVLNITLTTLDSAFGLSLDFSSVGITQIDDISKSFLKTLKTPVEIIVNGSEKEYKTSTQDSAVNEEDESRASVLSGKRYTYELLDSYKRNTDKVSLYYIDSRYNPGFFKERNINLATDTFITVYCPENGRYFFIDNEVFGNYETVSLERQIAAGIYNTTKEDIKKIAIISGHNEVSYPYLEKFLVNNAYDVENLDITTVEQIPEDISALIIASPQINYGNADIAKLRAYLGTGDKTGRNLLVFTNTSTPKNAYLEEFLSAEWGLQVGNEVVYDSGNSSTVIVEKEPTLKVDYSENDVSGVAADNLFKSDYLYLGLGKTRTVNKTFDKKGSVLTSSLLSTFDSSSFGRKMVENVIPSDDFKNISKQTGDLTGPLSVAGISYIAKSGDTAQTYETHFSNVALFGSTSMLETYYLSNMGGSTQASGEYILNLLKFMFSEENTVKILADALVSGNVNFGSDKTTYIVTGIVLLLVPVTCTIFAIVKWRKRKYL